MRVAGLAGGSASALQWGSKEQGVDFYDMKGDIEALLAPAKPTFKPAPHPAMHPGRCAEVWLNGAAIGFLGELHPKWRQSWDLPGAPVLFELALDAVLQHTVPAFEAVARHQAVQRDIAVLVAEQVSHSALMAAIWAGNSGKLLRDARLFDVYRPKISDATSGPAEKSLAVRLTLNSDDATLTDEQIDQAVQAVVARLVSNVGARQRV